ncbi:MAG: ComEA family DNA-binding protein [Patescibacteria group bacterium]
MQSNKSLLSNNKWQILLLLFGALLIGGGLLSSKIYSTSSDKVEIINPSASDNNQQQFVVEISGSVEHPGVYHMVSGSRIDDLIVACGGLSVDADRGWVDKNLNRAAKLTDGQKLYIPNQSEVLSANDSTAGTSISNSISQNLSKSININTASSSQLESLSGIGPVTAQKMIEGRPYSSVEELLTKKILSQKVYDKNKDLLSVY